MANKYSRETKATALATLKANGGNVTLTSRLLQIPRKTLEAWSKGEGMKMESVPQEMIEEKANQLADRLDEIADLLAAEMKNPEKIKKASLKDVSIALGVTIDKRNLLRHQPTSITQRTESRTTTKRYEAAVTKMIEEAAKKDFVIDREEAIGLLESQIPDIREYVN